MLRSTLLFAIAILLTMGAIGNVLAQHDQETEHRFTALETTVAMIASDVKELKDRGQFDWLKSLGLASLVGAEGVRVVNKRKESRGE